MIYEKFTYHIENKILIIETIEWSIEIYGEKA